ncbi:MAG: hypothetical protein K9J12_10550 [Melioribacteraceae bacterium]|nr:hypothetical protein [Melioribacteraceae bacterium]MCF8266075.1 hypothetical protein [Melioribacteraceae bacterium]
MEKLLGLRREDKNIWEKRVPIIPEHVRILKNDFEIETVLQPFHERAFTEVEFTEAGAEFDEDINQCPVIAAVKEIPIDLLKEDKIYLFFSHTIKGQAYNMPLLRRIMDLKCTLIDYECIMNENGKRLVFFGKYAGLAGMIEAFYGLGRRLKSLGMSTPFLQFQQAYKYKDIKEAKGHIRLIGEDIKLNGIPKELKPLIVGFAGYGNVSKGAQEIFDVLPFKQIKPEEISNVNKDADIIYKVVFEEKHLVENIENPSSFDLNDYFSNPADYKSKFEKYIPYLTMLINAIYWDDKYPRLITKKYLKENFQKTKLQIVADISCDINGSIEFTEKVTEPDIPGFVFNPINDSIKDGFEGEGIVNIAVDNLPTELPRDASVEFSTALYKFLPGIFNADFDESFQDCNLPEEIKRAVIVYKGELTPNFEYLQAELAKL